MIYQMANNHFYRGNNNRFKPKEQKNYIRVNYNIKAPTVRVTDDSGNQLGVLPIDAARKLAFERELDLIEIVPNANPPVCRITDFDKFRYEQKKQEKEARKKQQEKVIETKEVRIRPSTQMHDIEVKVNAIKKFLSEGKKVLLNLEYKKRELSHKDEGFKTINLFIERLKDFVIIEQMPKMEANRLICRMAPKKVGESNAVTA
jgi:translation initiation factor IF-3